MPAKINKHLSETGQEAIDDKGRMIRVILENLAMKYRSMMDRMEDVAGGKLDVLHIVGGGTQNELLNQFAADATGKRVVAGPIEATASGNVIMQAIATGQLSSLEEARVLVRRSFDVKEYLPRDTQTWEKRID